MYGTVAWPLVPSARVYSDHGLSSAATVLDVRRAA
jgi:hypothetical protein